MKLVYTHENHFIVGNIKNLIEAQDISVFIKNEFSQGAMGETSAFDCWPEIWVFDDHALEAATAIVKQSQQSTNAADWVCTHCNEKNDPAFEVCWNCNNEAPTSLNSHE